MPENTYDAIVLGVRCAGAPTAMLLARNARFRRVAETPFNIVCEARP